MVAAGEGGCSIPVQAERDEGSSLSPLLLFIQYEMMALTLRAPSLLH